MRPATARDRAWKVVQALYAKRLAGELVHIDLPIYTGQFDCESLANETPLPDGKRTAPPYDESNPNPLFRSHQRAWNELQRRFDAAWSEHERHIGIVGVEDRIPEASHGR